MAENSFRWLSTFAKMLIIAFVAISIFPAPLLGQEVILDNDGPGTSYAGGQWGYSSGADFYGSRSRAEMQNGATYTFQSSTTGEQVVSLWWTYWSSRCTDVPVGIYDGNTLIDTVTVNQQQQSLAGQWNVLDTYTFSNTARVVVRAQSGCSASADAVRFSPSAPSELDYVEIQGPLSVNENTTTDYTCVAYYMDGSSRAVQPEWGENSGYAGISPTGELTTGEVGSNQPCTISATYEEGGIERSDDYAITITDYIPPAELVIDNGDVGTSATGPWSTSGGVPSIGADNLYSKTPGAVYSYLTSLSGYYEVYLHWTNWPSRCTRVPVRIYDGNQLVYSTTIDQTQNGGQWNMIGTTGHQFSGPVRVEIEATSTACSTCADAVKFVSTTPAELSYIEITGPTSVNENSSADYTCIAHYTDGSSRAVQPEWGENSGYAGISPTGELTTGEVGSNQPCTISATYEEGGIERSDDYAITITDYIPPAELVIDNGDVGTSATGPWSTSGGVPSIGADNLYSKTPGAVYSYLTSLSGYYEVYLHWTNWPSRCTRVPVRIYDGNQLVYSTTIDQTQNGGQWNMIGTTGHQFSGPVRVEIEATSTACSTCADAVKFVSTTPAELSYIEITGPTSVNENSSADYTCIAHYTGGSSRAVQPEWGENSGYAGISPTGELTTGEVGSNQPCTISATYEEGGIERSDDYAITITDYIPPAETILDNDDPGTSYAGGGWGYSKGLNPYDGSSRAEMQNGATYTFQSSATGEQVVSLWWTYWSSRCTGVPVEIYDGNTLIDTVSVNQRQLNLAGRWNVLDAYTFNDAARVVIRAQSGCSANADAVKFESAGPSLVAVPECVNITQASAESLITGVGLVMGSVSTANHATIIADNVISTTPVAGTEVQVGSSVDLVVSLGPVVVMVDVPDVIGDSQAAAVAAINAVDGLSVGVVSTENHATVPAGHVISQTPVGGSSVAYGSTVDLLVSDGPAPVSVPTCVGLSRPDAETAIVGAGLVVGAVTMESNAAPENEVIDQDPSAGTAVAPGTAVDLVVSLGPASGGLLTETDFESVVSSEALREDGTGRDWYESRGQDPELLFLDESDIGGNTTQKAGFMASGSTNAYLTQELEPAQMGKFAMQWDIYVDSILDDADRDRGAIMMIGDDAGTGDGPNGNSNERYVFMSFWSPGGGDAPSDTMTLIARESGDDYNTSSAWLAIASGLSFDTWHTIKVVCDVPAGTYDVYVNGILSAAAVGSYSGASELTHISFAQWDDGAGAFYVDYVEDVSLVTVPAVVGDEESAAVSEIEALGLGTNVTTEYSTTVPEGYVILTVPSDGTQVPDGTIVDVVVSSGAEVPGVVGLSRPDAETAIVGAGLVVGAVTMESNAAPENEVIDQDPSAGTAVAPGTAVDLVVSLGPASGGLLTETDFESVVSSEALREDGTGRDWYESRGQDPELLFLDESDIGGNTTQKAGFMASGSTNAYLTQELELAQMGKFAMQWDIYVDSILDDADRDRGAIMMIGDDAGTGDGPNGNSNERYVFMSFWSPGGGDAPSDTMTLIARESGDDYNTSSAWLAIASGLSFDTWHTIKVVCDVPAGTYDVYVNGILSAAAVGSYSGASELTHISFAQWDDGAGAFYVDYVEDVSLVTVPAVVGDEESAAVSEIEALGLGTNVTTEYSTTVPEGYVILTVPSDGTQVPDGTIVDVVVSSGAEVPGVVGLSRPDAETAIVGAGLVVGAVTMESNAAPENEVIDQDPSAGTAVAPGTAVDLVVSLGPASGGLLTETDFESVVSSEALREDGTGRDWYESRGQDPELLFLDESDIGGNTTQKAGFMASGSTNAYLTQELEPAQMGKFAMQWDIYVDSILDDADRDRGAIMMIGDDAGTGDGPNGNSNERYVFMSFWSPGGGDAPSDTMTLIARESGDDYNTSSAWLAIASGLSFDTWHTIKVVCDVPAGTYDVYVNGILSAAAVGSYSGASELTHISFAQWDDGAGAFYVDYVEDVSLVTVPAVVGDEESAAVSEIEALGLGTNVTTEYSTTVPEGYVILTVPSDGTQVPDGTIVDVVVSSGAEVPGVVGLSRPDAETAIVGAGLVVGAVTMESNAAPENEVIDQDPSAGTAVAPGTAVDLVVSLGPASGGLLTETDFESVVSSEALREDGTGRDWYESRGQDPELLFLDESDIGGNTTQKAGFMASGSTNAYLTQELEPAQMGKFAMQWDIYVDSILDDADRDRGAIMMIGDDAGTGDGPNGNSNERYVFMSFWSPGGGDAPSDTMTLIARESGDDYNTSSAWLAIASGLSFDTWHTIKVVCDVPAGTYDVYVNGILSAAAVGSYSGASELTHISFAQWDDGAGAFYVDYVEDVSLVTVPAVVGDEESAAVSEIEALGLGTNVTTEYSTTVPEGYVILTVPSDGTQVPDGTIVDVVVSSGAPLVEVPDAVGDDQATAVDAIEGLGLTANVSYAYSDEVADGLVISQDPAAGSGAVSGSTVYIVVSLGPVPTDLVVDSDFEAQRRHESIG